MGVYRIHQGGVWSSLNKTSRLEEDIKAYQTYNVHFQYKYSEIIINRLLDHCIELVNLFEEKGDLVSAKKYLRKGFMCGFLSKNDKRIEFYKGLLRLYFPALHDFIKNYIQIKVIIRNNYIENEG